MSVPGFMNLRLNLAEIILPSAVYKCIIGLILCYVDRDVGVGDGISEEACLYRLNAEDL